MDLTQAAAASAARYGFPLCIQLSVPLALDDKRFAQILELLADEGFYGVELNITDFRVWTPERLRPLLERYSLKMTMLASGAYAREHYLSLGSRNEQLRRESVNEFCQTMLPFAGEMNCGIICGFIKGSDDACVSQLQRSVEDISSYADSSVVPLYLEATNHYDSPLLCTLDEAAALAGPRWNILPDTYHMNIEECSMSAPLAKYSGRYENLHISDNNRYFPGFGAIDFFPLLQMLKATGYRGTISIEGRTHGLLSEDIQKSCRYLAAVAARL